MNLSNFQSQDWANQWAGRWSVLSFSYWGEAYCQTPFHSQIERFLKQSIMIWREGKSFAYLRQSEKEAFATEVKDAITKGLISPGKLCHDFKNHTNVFLAFVDEHIDKDLTWDTYIRFQRLLIEEYYPLHIMVKMVVDVMNPELLERHLPLFEEARLYAEPVFTRSEEFMQAISKQLAAKLDIPAELVLCAVKEEFEAYLHKGQPFVARQILEDRYKACALLWTNQERMLVVGQEVDEVENLIKRSVAKTDSRIVKGSIGYPGKVTGRVRIVFDPAKITDFHEGEILVSGMTRPEFLSLMKKAAAFVTDGGGILCHAAIVARELKKPCIIGTLIATKELKEGEMVEVDAEAGVVRKL